VCPEAYCKAYSYDLTAFARWFEQINGESAEVRCTYDQSNVIALHNPPRSLDRTTEWCYTNEQLIP
jgi:glucose-6-phosphate isomerase